MPASATSSGVVTRPSTSSADAPGYCAITSMIDGACDHPLPGGQFLEPFLLLLGVELAADVGPLLRSRPVLRLFRRGVHVEALHDEDALHHVVELVRVGLHENHAVRAVLDQCGR